MEKYMDYAIKEAKRSLKTDDVPVGAVIVENDIIIAKSHNTKEKKNKVTRHAEINAIEKACKKKKTWYLNNCELYVTLEPCEMCMSAIKQARIKTVYYAVERNKKNSFNTSKKQINFGNEEAKKILKDFFEKKRK